MAKRFTDTNKYRKPFIRGLQGAYKLLWDYLYHDCDHAGIWIVDFDVAQLYIGKDMPVNKKDALKYFNKDEKRIIELSDGTKWFIPSFIKFQYGVLNKGNRAHNSVILILSELDLLKYTKPLTSPLQGAMVKDKDMDMVKEYLPPKVFLKNLIETDLQVLNMGAHISPEEFEDCLSQWSLNCEKEGWEYSGDEEKDLKRLRAWFQKWLNSWAKNGRQKNQYQTPEEVDDIVYKKRIEANLNKNK